MIPPQIEIILASIVGIIALFGIILNLALIIGDVEDKWSVFWYVIFITSGLVTDAIMLFIIAHDLILMGYL